MGGDAGGKPPALPSSSSSGHGKPAADHDAGAGGRRWWEVPVEEQGISKYDSDEDDPIAEARMMQETICYAKGCLEVYNTELNKGANFELDEPLFSRCLLFPDGLVLHLLFTAKNVATGEDDTTPQLFFAETRSDDLDPGVAVLTCLPIDPSRPDNRTGCAYCPRKALDKIHFYHPPKGICIYGDSEKKDDKRFQYDDWTSSSSSSSEEEEEKDSRDQKRKAKKKEEEDSRDKKRKSKISKRKSKRKSSSPPPPPLLAKA